MGKLHYRESPSEEERRSFAKYLAEDEQLILATGLGKAYLRSRFIINMVWPGLIFILLGLGLSYLFKLEPLWGLILGLILAILAAALKTVYTYHANRYLLTTRRVIIKRGLVAVKITAALFDKITHIDVEQSFIDRLLMHHGKVIINTAGMNKDEIVLTYIDWPIEFKNLLERLINREREQFGGRSGPVVTMEGEIV